MPQNNEVQVLDLVANQEKVKKILDTAYQLQTLCSELKFNAFQPGAIKELKMATLLGHNWILNKALPDACSRNNSNVFYEYLSAKEKGNGQIDRFFKDGPGIQHEKYLQSMNRIDRNDCFYLAYTDANPCNPLDILRIYRVSTQKIKTETDRQLQKSKNNISHIGFDEEFAKENGELVYEKK